MAEVDPRKILIIEHSLIIRTARAVLALMAKDEDKYLTEAHHIKELLEFLQKYDTPTNNRTVKPRRS